MFASLFKPKSNKPSKPTKSSLKKDETQFKDLEAQILTDEEVSEIDGFPGTIDVDQGTRTLMIVPVTEPSKGILTSEYGSLLEIVEQGNKHHPVDIEISLHFSDLKKYTINTKYISQRDQFLTLKKCTIERWLNYKGLSLSEYDQLMQMPGKSLKGERCRSILDKSLRYLSYSSILFSLGYLGSYSTTYGVVDRERNAYLITDRNVLSQFNNSYSEKPLEINYEPYVLQYSSLCQNFFDLQNLSIPGFSENDFIQTTIDLNQWFQVPEDKQSHELNVSWVELQGNKNQTYDFLQRSGAQHSLTEDLFFSTSRALALGLSAYIPLNNLLPRGFAYAYLSSLYSVLSLTEYYLRFDLHVDIKKNESWLKIYNAYAFGCSLTAKNLNSGNTIQVPFSKKHRDIISDPDHLDNSPQSLHALFVVLLSFFSTFLARKGCERIFQLKQHSFFPASSDGKLARDYLLRAPLNATSLSASKMKMH